MTRTHDGTAGRARASKRIGPAARARAASGSGRSGRPRVVVAVAVGWLAVLALAAVLADLLPLADPTVDTEAYVLAPFGSAAELLGTDNFGRSVLSRVVHGAQVSLVVGCVSAAIGLVVGGLVGMLAGQHRGVVDEVAGTMSDALLAFPALVLIIALTAVLGQAVSTMVIGLSIVSVPAFVRIARASTLRLRDREFVVAARVLGATTTRLMVHEIFPGVLRSVLALAPVVVANLIIAEASLSFLGLGVEPPTATWGVMISQGRSELDSSPHLVLAPSVLLFLTVLALYTVGDHASDRLTRRRSGGVA